eukprot:TRINITY_DN2611_c0_g1_i1.p1 TRINITY_DN2611_c0_g1~~TRINITY_DN2611_c0_g1_i1.p1  ORF type:complete len:252 (+),score=89.86 TRINITY_DN2611_c0_g1_i1:1924-2679(+)
MMRDEAAARLGSRPTMYILYNATAHGFSSTFNLSEKRVALPRYLPCGQRELPPSDSLSGLKGFPCIAMFPLGAPACPQEVVALLAQMPLLDSGNVVLSPSRVVVEEVDRTKEERSRQQRMEEMTARRTGGVGDLRTPRPADRLSRGSPPVELMAGEVDPSRCQSDGNEETSPPEPSETDTNPVASVSAPEPETPTRTVVAVRIDLLFYAALVLDGTGHNLTFLKEWMQAFAQNAIAGNVNCLSSPSREIKG